MSGSAPASAALCREARRILRKLDRGRARLVAQADGMHALVVPARKGGVRLLMRIEPELVGELLRRDWIRKDGGGGYVLSDAGRGFLARAAAQGDPFAAQHRVTSRRAVVAADGSERVLSVNEAESPLGWMYHRRIIGRAQFEAGERLRRDFTFACLMPRLGVDYAAPVMAGRRGQKEAPALPDIVLAAKQRFSRALAAVGPGLADLLVEVCCHLNGLEEAERARAWPRRSAKVVLRLALDRLAEHYGLVAQAPQTAPMRAWRAADAS